MDEPHTYVNLQIEFVENIHVKATDDVLKVGKTKHGRSSPKFNNDRRTKIWR